MAWLKHVEKSGLRSGDWLGIFGRKLSGGRMLCGGMLLVLAGCAAQNVVVDNTAVEFMPRDVALQFVKTNTKPASHTYDPCIVTDTGVMMDGTFHPYDKLELLLEIIPLHRRYDVRLAQTGALFPDICSYYFGEQGSADDPAVIEKQDNTATAFRSLGVRYAAPAAGR